MEHARCRVLQFRSCRSHSVERGIRNRTRRNKPVCFQEGASCGALWFVKRSQRTALCFSSVLPTAEVSTQFRAGSDIEQRKAGRIANFSSFEACASHHRKVSRHVEARVLEGTSDSSQWQQLEIINWDPRNIVPRCVDRAAYTAVAARWRIPDTDNFWERACVVACVGLPPDNMKRFMSRATDFGQCGHSSMIPKLVFLHEELQLDRATLAALCTVHSRILDYSLEYTMKKRVAFFKAYLDVDGRQLGKIVAKHPRLLWAHMELDVKAKIQLLAGIVERAEEVPCMLRKQPQILALSEVTIQEKVTKLVELLSLDAAELSQVLTRAPSVLARRTEALQSNVEVLAEYLGDDAARLLVIKYATVLTLSSKTLAHKLATLTGTCGVAPDLLLARPALLGYSLEKRILPRFHAMHAAHKGLLLREQEEREEAAQNTERGTRMRKAGTFCKQRMTRLFPVFNLNALYLSDEKFDKYLENVARKYFAG